jgi:hypothetical protein
MESKGNEDETDVHADESDAHADDDYEGDEGDEGDDGDDATSVKSNELVRFSIGDISLYAPEKGVFVKDRSCYPVSHLNIMEKAIVCAWMKGFDLQSTFTTKELIEEAGVKLLTGIDLTTYNGERGYWKQYTRATIEYNQCKTLKELIDGLNVQDTEPSEHPLIDSKKVVSGLGIVKEIYVMLANKDVPEGEFIVLHKLLKSVDSKFLLDKFVRVKDVDNPLASARVKKEKVKLSSAMKKEREMRRLEQDLDKDAAYDVVKVSEFIAYAKTTVRPTTYDVSLIATFEELNLTSSAADMIREINNLSDAINGTSNMGIRLNYKLGQAVCLYRTVSKQTWEQIEEEDHFSWYMLFLFFFYCFLYCTYLLCFQEHWKVEEGCSTL